ncbi:MAG: hypothetical protein ACYS99_15220 [Planctomycetota bacterium]
MRNRRLVLVLTALALLVLVYVAVREATDEAGDGRAPEPPREGRGWATVPQPDGPTGLPDPTETSDERSAKRSSTRLPRSAMPVEAEGAPRANRLMKIVSDGAGFASRFASRHAPVEMKVEAVTGKTPVPDGAVFRFPAGFHEWDLTRLNLEGRFPEDVTITGAGMNATILRVERYSLPGAIRRLVVRDLTLDGGGDDIFDLGVNWKRRPDLAVTLERCRLVHWGSRAAIDSTFPVTVLAIECQFEAGYGRPGEHQSFIRSNALLGRFERCLFVGPVREVVYAYAPRSAVLFGSCRFLGAPESLARQREFGTVVTEDCTLEPFHEEEAAELRHDFLEVFTREAGPAERVFKLLGDYEMDAAAIPKRGSWMELFFRPDEGKETREVKFPAGVHEWRPPGALRDLDGMLLLTGRGTNKTLVRVGKIPKARHVAYRDLTLDLGRGAATHSGTRRLRARFDRCRVIGFDGGAGGGAFEFGPGLFLARDSEVLTGYGRSPSKSTLFRLGQPVLARFESCRIRGINREFWRGGRKSALVLSGCRIEEIYEKLRKVFTSTKMRVWLDDTSISYREEKPKKERPRPFSDLNPAWGRGWAR